MVETEMSADDCASLRRDMREGEDPTQQDVRRLLLTVDALRERLREAGRENFELEAELALERGVVGVLEDALRAANGEKTLA